MAYGRWMKVMVTAQMAESDKVFCCFIKSNMIDLLIILCWVNIPEAKFFRRSFLFNFDKWILKCVIRQFLYKIKSSIDFGVKRNTLYFCYLFSPSFAHSFSIEPRVWSKPATFSLQGLLLQMTVDIYLIWTFIWYFLNLAYISVLFFSSPHMQNWSCR